MTSGVWRLVTVAMVAGLAGCAPCPEGRRVIEPTTADLVSEGQRIYLHACASCHGPGATGDGPVAASLTKRPTDLTRLAQRAGGTFPREQLVATMTGDHGVAAHGTRDMPVWSERFEPSGAATGAAGIYAERRTNALAAYLATIQQPKER